MASQEVLTALETLHREIEKLEPAIKHVETAQKITQTVKEIPQKHIDLLLEINNSDTRHKEELKQLFILELASITNENKKLQNITSEIQEQVKLEQKSLTQLKETVESFHEKVRLINFPERLDKLDANVAGIMAAVQSVQSRLDGLDRNISDRLRDIQDFQKESQSLFKSSLDNIKNELSVEIENSNRKTNTLHYIGFGILILIMIMIYVTK